MTKHSATSHSISAQNEISNSKPRNHWKGIRNNSKQKNNFIKQYTPQIFYMRCEFKFLVKQQTKKTSANIANQHVLCFF